MPYERGGTGLIASESQASGSSGETAAASMPSEQSASLWWPADRAWFVATDIDLVTTFVGGSAGCIDDLLAAPGLEAALVPVDQRFTWDADTVNPWPVDAPG